MEYPGISSASWHQGIVNSMERFGFHISEIQAAMLESSFDPFEALHKLEQTQQLVKSRNKALVIQKAHQLLLAFDEDYVVMPSEPMYKNVVDAIHKLGYPKAVVIDVLKSNRYRPRMAVQQFITMAQVLEWSDSRDRGFGAGTPLSHGTPHVGDGGEMLSVIRGLLALQNPGHPPPPLAYPPPSPSQQNHEHMREQMTQPLSAHPGWQQGNNGYGGQNVDPQQVPLFGGSLRCHDPDQPFSHPDPRFSAMSPVTDDHSGQDVHPSMQGFPGMNQDKYSYQAINQQTPRFAGMSQPRDEYLNECITPSPRFTSISRFNDQLQTQGIQHPQQQFPGSSTSNREYPGNTRTKCMQGVPVSPQMQSFPISPQSNPKHPEQFPAPPAERVATPPGWTYSKPNITAQMQDFADTQGATAAQW